MGRRSESYNIRLSESEKQEFKEYVEQSDEFNSLAGLFRTAVYREINDSGASIDTDELRDVFAAAISGVERDIQDIVEDIEVVKDTLSDPDDVREFAAELYDSLPIYPPNPDELHKPPEVGFETASEFEIDYVAEKSDVDSLKAARAWSTAEAWAEYFDESIDRTQRALSMVLTQYDDVDVVHDERPTSPEVDRDNEILRRYYRIEPNPDA